MPLARRWTWPRARQGKPLHGSGLDRIGNEIVRIHVPETGAAQVQAIQVFQDEPVRPPVRFRAAVLDHDALAAPGVNRVDRAKPSVWQTARTDAFDAVRQVVFIQTDEFMTVACVAPRLPPGSKPEGADDVAQGRQQEEQPAQ